MKKKKILRNGITIILLTIVQSAFCQTVELTNLSLVDSLYTLSGDIFTGTYRWNYGDGQLRQMGYIKEGRFDSISSYYSMSGRIRQMIWYKNGIEQKRKNFTYSVNGLLIVSLKDGVEHGLWERYYPSGQIKERYYYNMGEPVGTWTSWDHKGRKVYESDNDSDTVISVIHDYKRGGHNMLIRHYDRNSKKVVKKEVVRE